MATKYKNSAEGQGTVINIIGNGTEIKGDITANGDVRIDGHLYGNINTQNKLIIGETGYVEGEINAKIADISGKIKGKLNAKEITYLRGTSNFDGDLTTNKLVIEEGAIFNGTCTMKDSAQTPSQTKK